MSFPNTIIWMNLNGIQRGQRVVFVMVFEYKIDRRYVYHIQKTLSDVYGHVIALEQCDTFSGFMFRI